MIYEQRVYYVSPAKKTEFIDFWGGVVMPAIATYGAKTIGMWATLIGERNQVICIIAHESVEAQIECWKKFSMTKEWTAKRPSVPVNSLSVSIIEPTKYSPLQ